jgi:uncharacterized protein (TIGR00251 family)
MRVDAAVRRTDDGRGTLFWVRVVPGASRESVVGWQADGMLRVRVSAPPERGRANEALLDLLAGALGVRASALSLVSGAGSREKRIQADGVSPERVRALGTDEEHRR